jgi:hypothetical protein
MVGLTSVPLQVNQPPDRIRLAGQRSGTSASLPPG